MNIICQSLYYQYIWDTFHFFKSSKTFKVIITTLLCCPCYMPKYVPRLEGIMHSSGGALCLLTLGHVSAYNMENTIALYKYCPEQYIINNLLFFMCQVIIPTTKHPFSRNLNFLSSSSLDGFVYYVFSYDVLLLLGIRIVNL
jgi:hypothetical protein